jgi:hypothetical protein
VATVRKSSASTNTPPSLGEKALAKMLEEKKKQAALTTKRSRKNTSLPSPDKHSKKPKLPGSDESSPDLKRTPTKKKNVHAEAGCKLSRTRFVHEQAQASGSDGSSKEQDDKSAASGPNKSESESSDGRSASSQQQFDAKKLPATTKSIATCRVPGRHR